MKMMKNKKKTKILKVYKKKTKIITAEYNYVRYNLENYKWNTVQIWPDQSLLQKFKKNQKNYYLRLKNMKITKYYFAVRKSFFSDLFYLGNKIIKKCLKNEIQKPPNPTTPYIPTNYPILIHLILPFRSHPINIIIQIIRISTNINNVVLVHVTFSH